jgi:hypothetical protein
VPPHPHKSVKIKKNQNARKAEPIPVAESIQQAAASWGFSQDVLKLAKKLGCPAFRSTRVYYDDFKKWYDANSDRLKTKDAKRDWEIRRLKAQCKQIEWKQKIEEGKYTSNEKIYASIAAAAQRMKSVLRQKLEVEYPTLLAGADVTEHRKKGIELVDEICRTFSEGTAQWTP